MKAQWNPACIVGASLTLAVFACLASVASADPPTDPCGVFKESDAAHDFGLAHARKTSVAVRQPGNTAGVVRVRCRATAWSGQKPSSRQAERLKMIARELVNLRIESWVPDWDGHADRWKTVFPSKMKALMDRARSQFVGSLGGSTVTLPKEGEPHALAFAAHVGGLYKVRAFWWDHRGTILSMNVLQGAGSAARPSLLRFARDLIRPFFSK